jgi:hypothetical protein
MPLDLADTESTYLGGKSLFEEWRRDFEARFTRSLGETLLRATVQQTPPEVQQFVDPTILKALGKPGGNNGVPV